MFTNRHRHLLAIILQRMRKRETKTQTNRLKFILVERRVRSFLLGKYVVCCICEVHQQIETQ